MNVFVLCTGRCGSVTFTKACQHIKNYTTAHESKVALFGPQRVQFADNHIEVDNRLAWFLGRLEEEYGDQAFYIHLIREREPTAKSYSKRLDPGFLMNAYKHGIYIGIDEEEDPYNVALDLYDTINANIQQFLKDKPLRMTVQLENVDEGFREFWQNIGAEGSLELALAELHIVNNEARKPTSIPKRSFTIRLARKIIRAISHLPQYIKDV